MPDNAIHLDHRSTSTLPANRLAHSCRPPIELTKSMRRWFPGFGNRAPGPSNRPRMTHFLRESFLTKAVDALCAHTLKFDHRFVELVRVLEHSEMTNGGLDD